MKTILSAVIYIYRNQLIPLFQICLYRQKYLIKRNVCQLVVVFFCYLDMAGYSCRQLIRLEKRKVASIVVRCYLLNDYQINRQRICLLLLFLFDLFGLICFSQSVYWSFCIYICFLSFTPRTSIVVYLTSFFPQFYII